jgi:hypothetical protein
MKNFLWTLIAWLLSRESVADYIIRTAMRTPYSHLPGYMNRWWFANAYHDSHANDLATYKRWLPAIRVHQILRADDARHPHDHPWNARTIILRGWYAEVRYLTSDYQDMRVDSQDGRVSFVTRTEITGTEEHVRRRGDTAELMHGEYHHIADVSEGGVWTLFFTWPYISTWGFLVNGGKVPWRNYGDI